MHYLSRRTAVISLSVLRSAVIIVSRLITSALDQELAMSLRSRFALLTLFTLAAAVAIAQPPVKPEPAAIPRASNVVPAKSLGFASIHFAKLWEHPAALPLREANGKFEFVWLMQSMIGLAPSEIEHLTVFWRDASTPFLLVTGRKDITPPLLAESLTRAGSTPPAKPADPRVVVAPGAEFPYLISVNHRTVLLGSEAAGAAELVKLHDHWQSEGPLADALAAAGKHTLTIGVNVEALALLPLPVGAPLLEAKIAVLTADLDEKALNVELALTFTGADQAKAASPILRAKLNELAGYASAQEKKSYDTHDASGSVAGPLLDLFAQTLKNSKIQADGPLLRANATINLSMGVNCLLTALPDSALAPRGSSPATNNLKQIGLAMHSYHDVHGAFPSNSYDKDGKPLLSWRVQILPYLEQQALYQQFKLNEPWDSPTNKPLAKVVIRTYGVPGRPTEPGLTYFQCFTQPKNSKDNARPFLKEGQTKGLQYQNIPDGTSNTIMVAEAADPVIWSKPDDMMYEAGKPIPKLGGPNGRFTLLWCDGSVRTFRRGQIDDTNLRNVITGNDGIVVNIPN